MGVSLDNGVVFSSGNLEINVTAHCNLRCRSCSHLSPIAPVSEIDPVALAEDLASIAPVFRPKAVKLVGGEPLLHRDLLAVVRVVRDSGVAARVQMASNGLPLARADSRIWSYVDDLRISMYPVPGYDAEWLRRLVAVREMGVDVRVFAYGFFRHSYTSQRCDDDELVGRIYRTCKMAREWYCSTVHDGYFYKCSPSYLMHTVEGLDTGGPAANGVPLSDGDLAARIHAYLVAEEPLPACRFCLGSAGAVIEHSQVARSAWRAPQGARTDEVVDLALLADLESTDMRANYYSVEVTLDELGAAPSADLWEKLRSDLGKGEG